MLAALRDTGAEHEGKGERAQNDPGDDACPSLLPPVVAVLLLADCHALIRPAESCFAPAADAAEYPLMQRTMRASLLAALVVGSLLAGCAHSIRNVEDCKALDLVQRAACSACTLQNKADGYLGVFEYKPDNDPGNRCIKLK